MAPSNSSKFSLRDICLLVGQLIRTVRDSDLVLYLASPYRSRRTRTDSASPEWSHLVSHLWAILPVPRCVLILLKLREVSCLVSHAVSRPATVSDSQDAVPAIPSCSHNGHENNPDYQQPISPGCLFSASPGISFWHNSPGDPKLDSLEQRNARSIYSSSAVFVCLSP